MPQVQETTTALSRRVHVDVGRLDSSIRAHPDVWMYGLLAAGLLIRIWHASGTFLNADEAMHFAAANQTSWWLTYQASLSLAHPPLLIFLLHAWRHIGTSELVLRMPSILAGMAFCWLTFRWLLMLFEKTIAWTAFVFVLFLPSSIQLSSEVRQYALFLAFAMASAYLLEVAFAKHSVAAMLSGVCLWLAILSHFSAFLFAAALGGYAIWRMVKERPPLRLIAAWQLGQVVAISLSYFLYVTQIFRLEQLYRGFSLTQGFMGSGFLAKYYFDPAKMNPFMFVLARTGGFFQFAFQQLMVGDIAFVLFVIGIVLLFRGRGRGRVISRALNFLLLAPFGLNIIAALVRAYPYGGTRHSAFLLPFAVAGISVALAWLCRNRLALSVAVVLFIALFCTVFPAKQFAEAPPGAQKIAKMKAAMSFIQQLAPGEPIFADAQTSFLLGHYLCGQRPIALNQSLVGFVSYECGGHKVIAARHQYIFTISTFQDQWREMVREYKLQAGAKVWVAQMGSGMHLESELEAAGKLNVVPHDFGKEISFFDVTVGQSTPPAS